MLLLTFFSSSWFYSWFFFRFRYTTACWWHRRKKSSTKQNDHKFSLFWYETVKWDFLWLHTMLCEEKCSREKGREKNSRVTSRTHIISSMKYKDKKCRLKQCYECRYTILFLHFFSLSSYHCHSSQIENVCHRIINKRYVTLYVAYAICNQHQWMRKQRHGYSSLWLR